MSVIKKASAEIKLTPKLTTKIYFNYVIKNHYDTVLSQMIRICEKLKFIPNEWHVQICCNPNINDFDKYYDDFKELAKKTFKTNIKFFIESCSLWEANTIAILESNKLYGSVFSLNNYYKNINNKRHFEFPFICLNLLSGGKHYKKNNFIDSIVGENIAIDQLIENNIIFFIKLSKLPNMLYSVTQVRNKENYNDLIKKINFLSENKSFINDQYEKILYKENILNKNKSDEYGIIYKNNYTKILRNPKRYLHEVKTSLFPSSKKSWF